MMLMTMVNMMMMLMVKLMVLMASKMKMAWFKWILLIKYFLLFLKIAQHKLQTVFRTGDVGDDDDGDDDKRDGRRWW